MTTANLTVIENVLFKRGNTAVTGAYTGVPGEIIIDTTVKTIRVQDGSTAGGTRLATYTELGTQSTLANANAATQTTEINSLRANITAANAAITSLQSNAAIQATLLDTLTGNAATQSQVLDTLTSNAATQANTLSTLLGNAITQQTSLIDLLANAVTQSQQIASVTGTYSNANVATYLSAFDGNILPSANVTYSLGSETRQWRDLWVSNNTIYIGNTPVRVAGGTLLVNGAPVSGGYSNANVAAYLPTYTGNIAANIVSPTVPTIGNTASAGEAGITYLTGGLSKWAIFTEGAFTVGVWTDVQPGWTVTDNNGFTDIIAGRGSFGAASFQTTVNNWPAPASGKTYVFTSPGYQLGYTNPVEITVGSNDWRFGTDGTLTFPTGGNLIFDSSAASVIDGVTSIVANGNISASQYNFANGVNILSTVAGTYSNANVASYLPTYTGNIAANIVKNGRTWTFGTTGNLTLPGNIITELGPVTGNIVTNVRHWESAGPNLYIWFDAASKSDVVAIGNFGNIVGWTVTVEDGNQALVTATNPAGYFSISTDESLTGSGNVTFTSPDYALPAGIPLTVSVGDYNWTFGSNGDLTAPGDITTGTNDGRFIQDCSDGTTSMRWINVDEESDSTQLIRAYTGDPKLDTDIERAQIKLNWQNADQSGLTIRSFDQDTDDEYDWEFRGDGNLVLPDNGAIIFEDGDGIIGRDGDDLLISWDDEELVLRSANGDVLVEADDDVEIRSGYNFGTGVYGGRWIFNDNGELQGIPQDTANSSEYDGGYIQFVGNSSGDGNGYTTLQLIPDETRVAGDQYLIIDPTDPGHIHIRAGGTQDNSFANLFLGGENSYVKIGSGSNPPVTVTANSNQWQFNSDGNLTLPAGGVISEGGGISGAIQLKPAGGANANQALLIYPTGNAEGDHVHLTAAGGSTELYLGNDFHYVKLVDGGNIELRATTANLSAQASWNFDTTGNIDARQTLGIKVPNGVPTDVAVINSTTGSWEMNPNLSLATTGGSGSGLTVNVAEEGGYASTIEIATAGTGYTNGDLITVTSGTSNATFTIVIGGRNSWQFGGTGNLTLPSANFDASPAPSSSPSIVFPSEGYIGASLGTESEKFLIKSEGKTWTFDGSYEDLTFPGGTVFSNQNIAVVANANLTVTTFDGTSHFTTFGSDGNLTLPETGYLRVGTGIVAGFASSPAPVISGFSSISAQNFRFQGNGVNILSAVGVGTTDRLTNGGSEVALQANGVTTFGNTATISNNGGEFRLWADNDISVYRNGRDGYGIAENEVKVFADNTQITATTPNGLEIKQGNLIIPNDKAVVFANGVNILSTVAGTYSNANVTSYFQSLTSLALGSGAGATAQGVGSVALGVNAGNDQGYYAVAIGIGSGRVAQSDSAVAVGGEAGWVSQGINSVAVGYRAGTTNQANSSIILNATGANLNATTANTFTVAPVRNDVSTSNVGQVMFYNTTSKEITYGNTISIAGNLSVAGNVVQQSAYYETYANVANSGGNLTCNFVNGATFYATLTANVTVNFTNVVATAGRVTGATLIVDQGATAYGVANIQINGGGVQTIKYAGGTPNTGTASNTDIMSFSLISLDGTNWRVLGQISNYG